MSFVPFSPKTLVVSHANCQSKNNLCNSNPQSVQTHRRTNSKGRGDPAFCQEFQVLRLASPPGSHSPLTLIPCRQESEKKRAEERQQQKRWHEQHRHALRLQEQEAAHGDPDAALRRFMQIRDAAGGAAPGPGGAAPDWVTVEFETTHL